ncbi:MAG: hypothetical protein JWN48_939 [Myxococcaceae bacterium]|nr:hypothetical protein [Myxococcaceae bacterium]
MRQRSLVLTSLLVACSAAAPPPAHTRELALELYPQRADVWAFDVALQGRLVVPAGRAAELVRCEVERQGLGRGSQPV